MSIMRITVRTFQNEQHAEMFIAISQKIYEDALKDKLKVNFTMIQNTSLKNQVTSIWKYDDENHVKEIRSYLFSSRDNVANTSIYIDRANRSLKNLFETLPIFIGLILLSIMNDVDNSSLAMIWLLSRIIYVPVYIAGINYLRTGIWAIALICLIIMSINFL